MNRNFAFTVFWCILIILVQGGCNRPTFSSPTPTELGPQIDQKKPHIRGMITSLDLREDQTSSMVVEGAIEADTRYDKAFIGMNGETKVFIEDNGGYRIGNLQDLAIGQTVEVLFIGPIATSYPVQATAGEIIIKTASMRVLYPPPDEPSITQTFPGYPPPGTPIPHETSRITPAE